jgi:imidazolonepropionase-like amidohydrolase
MTLEDVVEELDLVRVTQDGKLDQVVPTGGYASDLLSCVMAGAKKGSIWVTLQAHSNVVAVAALLDLSAVIVTEGAELDSETIAKANGEGVVVLSTQDSTYDVVGRLWEMGLTNS